MRGGEVASRCERVCAALLRSCLAGGRCWPAAQRRCFTLPFRSRELQGKLAFFATASDCNFRLALVGRADLVDGASADSLRVITASWDGTARLWDKKNCTDHPFGAYNLAKQ